MSFEMKWTIVAGILCICIAYGIGYQVGNRRAKEYLHMYYQQLIKHANSVIDYKKGGNEKDAEF